MRSRCLALFAVLLALAGCQALPGGGPWMNNASSISTEVMPFDVIDLTTTTVVAYRPGAGRGPSPAVRPPSSRSTVSPGDALTVLIFERFDGGLFPTLQRPAGNVGTRFVTAGGMIDVPFVGAIRVAGLDPQQVEAEIAARLKDKVQEPTVIVEFAADPGNSVTVSGEVVRPGRLSLRGGPRSVVEAINQAGGPTYPKMEETPGAPGAAPGAPAASAGGGASTGAGDPRAAARGAQASPLKPVGGPTQHEVVVRRRGAVILERLLSDLQAGGDIGIEKGDEIVVAPNTQVITVVGAVTRASNIPVTKADMSLAEALGDAVGLMDLRSNKTGVFVFRMSDLQPGAAARARIFRLDLMQPASVLVAQQFGMKARDVIYVTNAPVNEYDKIITPIYRTLTLWSTARGTLPALRF